MGSVVEAFGLAGPQIGLNSPLLPPEDLCLGAETSADSKQD